MAPKPPDGTFIIDSDLRPSLPTSDSVLVCAHSVPEGKSFGVWVLASSSPLVSACVSHKEREFAKERKVWHPLECESYFLFVSFSLLRTHTHALIHTNARTHTQAPVFDSALLELIFFFSASHTKQKLQDGLFCRWRQNGNDIKTAWVTFTEAKYFHSLKKKKRKEDTTNKQQPGKKQSCTIHSISMCNFLSLRVWLRRNISSGVLPLENKW